MEETLDNFNAALSKNSGSAQAVVDVSSFSDFTTSRDADDVAFLTSFPGVHYLKHPEVWGDAWPVFHVSKGDTPFLIVHGTQDQEVPISQAQELFQKLQSAGV